MHHVLILDPVHPEAPALLKSHGYDITHLLAPTPDDIATALPKADALILRGRKLSMDHWELAKKLRIVSRHGVGCDNIPFDLMQDRGVTVSITADANALSVAEHAFALMLAACKRIPQANQAVRDGQWNKRDSLFTREVSGAQVLILGFGRIGQQFFQRVQAFGGNTSVYDPFLPADAPLPDGITRVDDLTAGLSEADIVSLHMPITPQTRNMLGATQFAALRDGAILVNTARGGIVDEAMVQDWLNRNPLCVYATDVLDDEPPKIDNGLVHHPQVILTPHSAAMTREGAYRMALHSAQNVHAFFQGSLQRHCIV